MLQVHWKSTSMPNKYLRDRSALALESVSGVIKHFHQEWKEERLTHGDIPSDSSEEENGDTSEGHRDRAVQ